VTELQQAQDVVSLRDAKPEDFQPVYLPHQGPLSETTRDEDQGQLSMWGPRQLELTLDWC